MNAMNANNAIRVFITIDVETSIGGAFTHPERLLPVGAEKRIYGKIGNKEYGIPLIMNILEKYNLKGTFFVEPFCSLFFGEEMVKGVCKYILNRGQDVQMHLHPNYQIFCYSDWRKRAKEKRRFSDFIAHYPLEKQIEIIKEAKRILKIAGVNPIAFRAGCFAANLDTLNALKKNGFLFDSSYNASFLGKTCFIYPSPITQLNDLISINGIYELPITNYYDFKIAKFKRLRCLDICAVSFYEMKKILKQAIKNGPKHITFILHSFSFLKKKDVQYKTARPNSIVIKRFKNLCQFLSENSDVFKVSTFSEFAQFITQSKMTQFSNDGIHHFPFIGNLPSLLRYIPQAMQYF